MSATAIKTINLNDSVRVVLTDFGLEYRNKKWAKIMGVLHKPLTEKVYVAPLWSLMDDFGELMYMGSTLHPFESLTLDYLGELGER